MTMGDWIQGPDHGHLFILHRPWTGTWPELHCFEQFWRARPSLPWSVGGWRGVRWGMPEVGLRPVVHVSERCCQNPQCFAVQRPYVPQVLPTHPGYTPPYTSLLYVHWRHAAGPTSTLSTFCQNSTKWITNLPFSDSKILRF